MSHHTNFLSVVAKDNYDLGRQLGEHFRKALQAKMGPIVRDELWANKVERSKEYLEATERHFPQYVQEIKGYAFGANIDFMELWTRSLGDELAYYKDHCTSVITNNGRLIAHNEDWDKDAAQEISVLQKTIGSLTTFELYYLNTLGGNSASINSHGCVQLINSLTHTDWQMGVPHNVVARFLSETSDPEKDFERLSKIKRSTGYNHSLVSAQGAVWNLECTAKLQDASQPSLPFVHTNHYLTNLKALEATESSSTFKRLDVARKLVRPEMSVDEAKRLVSDTSEGDNLSVFNERTIARMVVNLERKVAEVWLRRETDKGWIEYPLTFL